MLFREVLSLKTWLWTTLVIILVYFASKVAIPLIKLMAKPFFAFSMFVFAKFYNKRLAPKKKELFESMEKHLNKVEGDVLEIGAGAGANFAFYPHGCTISALDPNPHMNYYLLHNDKFYPHVTLKRYIVGSAEDMNQIEDHSVSAVVSTLVLCSVESMEKVLKEVIRVLKPGGRFYFMEHVKGKGFILTLQKWNQPWWYYFGDGCHLMRDIEASICNAGFKFVKCESFNAENVGIFIKPHIMGYADV